MSAGTEYWRGVVASGLEVPQDRPLPDLTAELTTMLGSPDPEQRDGIAYPTLTTWLGRGVYDDLLAGLGDGMAAGLTQGLGEEGTDSVFRRSFSVLVLAECLARDNQQALLPPDKVLEWGDRVAAWYLREQDLRGFVPGSGWAHALAHGADALRALAASPHLSDNELTVLLDVIADRLLLPTTYLLGSGEPDRMARATMAILRRDLVPMSVAEPWVVRIGNVAASPPVAGDPFATTRLPEQFLRALYLQLSIAPGHPAQRADLLLVLVEVLKRSNPHYLTELAL